MKKKTRVPKEPTTREQQEEVHLEDLKFIEEFLKLLDEDSKEPKDRGK